MKAILYVLFLLLGIIIYIYNNIITLKNNVKKSRSGIDVYLQQRFDLIPNLIEVTKGYMNYEKETLIKITQLRALYNETKDSRAMSALNNRYNNIMANVENYPELKTGEQFLKLQKSLIKIESQLQAARRIYNNDVTKYNIKISTFPISIVANLANFKEEDLFELEGSRENITVEM